MGLNLGMCVLQSILRIERRWTLMNLGDAASEESNTVARRRMVRVAALWGRFEVAKWVLDNYTVVYAEQSRLAQQKQVFDLLLNDALELGKMDLLRWLVAMPTFNVLKRDTNGMHALALALKWRKPVMLADRPRVRTRAAVGPALKARSSLSPLYTLHVDRKRSKSSSGRFGAARSRSTPPGCPRGCSTGRTFWRPWCRCSQGSSPPSSPFCLSAITSLAGARHSRLRRPRTPRLEPDGFAQNPHAFGSTLTARRHVAPPTRLQQRALWP